ncbi:unnamed protein product [Moneuplotes crassus]|uniref:Uncharacterized protein n=1 Tax=Euplotes crassus TaxID=5936 RepID=A0AAD1XEP0_EUPCR|nr:unnamed protein product [Moneuplotes crassus]
MSTGRDITNSLSQTPPESTFDTIKAISGLIAGSIVISYVISKYSGNPIKTTYEWFMGKPTPKRVRRSRRARQRQRNRTDCKKIEEFSEEDDSVYNRNPDLSKNGMSYIAEENTEDQESSLCEDILFPAPDEETSSITYTHKRGRKMYFNSNDELIDAESEAENVGNLYAQPPKTHNISKLYRQREIEATKFVNSIDHAIHTFKKNKVKNYETFNDALKANKREADKLKLKEQARKDSKEPCSLNDKFKAEMQQLSPKSRKEKFRALDEKSIRMDNSDHDDFESTFASENVYRSKKSDKRFVPSSNELTTKNYYIFFELLSAYTENFVQSKPLKRSKGKNKGC